MDSLGRIKDLLGNGQAAGSQLKCTSRYRRLLKMRLLNSVRTKPPQLTVGRVRLRGEGSACK